MLQDIFFDKLQSFILILKIEQKVFLQKTKRTWCLCWNEELSMSTSIRLLWDILLTNKLSFFEKHCILLPSLHDYLFQRLQNGGHKLLVVFIFYSKLVSRNTLNWTLELVIRIRKLKMATSEWWTWIVGCVSSQLNVGIKEYFELDVRTCNQN